MIRRRMEFAVSEMKKENSEMSPEENVLSDKIDFVVKTDTPLTEENEINVSRGAIPDQEEIKEDSNVEIGIESVLLENNEEEECIELINENSINTSVKSFDSLSNVSNELLKCPLSVDTRLPEEKYFHKSSSYNDVHLASLQLSTSLSHTASDRICNYEEDVKKSNKCTEINTTCDVGEEIVFNNKLSENVPDVTHTEKQVTNEKYRSCEVKNKIERVEDIAKCCNIGGQLMISNSEAEDLINSMKLEKNFNGQQKLSKGVQSTKLQSNITSRPTLLDDSRSVKISLATNPINLMQSNAQFLNKSRNFLNFITEKSINIMENALLPQHLQMKHNSVAKTMDNNYNERKCPEESSPADPALLGSIFNNQKDLIIKEKKITNLQIGSTDVQKEENELSISYGDEISPIINVKDNTNTSTEKNDKYLSISDCTRVKNIDDVKQPNDNVLYSEANGNCVINNITFNSEDKDYHESVTGSICQELDEDIESEKFKEGLLRHPAYLTLLRNYADLKAQHLKQQERVEYLEERNRILEAENKGEIFTVQIETLEKTINRLTSELHASLEAQEIFKREYNAANKERESMVMKYAVGEKQLIDSQRAREYAERKVKEMSAQQESLQTKLREMQGERARICNILSGKHREVTEFQREVEKLREDVKMRDIKLQWTQNKLKMEMDLQKETQQKLDKATTRINEMKEECEQVRKETQETMRKFQQSEENKAVTLDQQLKEQQARLILERHVTEDKEMLRLQLQKEVDSLKHRQQVLIEENNTLSLKLQDVEENKLNIESELRNVKTITDSKEKEILKLLNKVSELEALIAQLEHKDQYLMLTEAEIQHLRSANEELQSDMSACRQKEAEMLDFTQKLTDTNVRIQSEFIAIEARAKKLEQEHGPLHDRIRELTQKIKSLEETLTVERKTRTEECESLGRHLAERRQAVEKLTQQLEDSQGENAVLKRKQQISMKEMARELQQCRKKLEIFETSPYNSLGVASRTGSNASLNTGDTVNGALSDNSINGDHSIQSIEPSKQTLIDRIIKLQEGNARKAEKLDFFEEHTRILVEELQKKKRIIQTYILHESSGAMGNNERDKYKAELARHGGIMASVYNQRVSDDNMTLELSLEINQKLQAVLEDALFKNITLKDNIDTLGEEIARLTLQNQKRRYTK